MRLVIVSVLALWACLCSCAEDNTELVESARAVNADVNTRVAAERQRVETVRADAVARGDTATVAKADEDLALIAKMQGVATIGNIALSAAANPDDPDAAAALGTLAGTAFGPWGGLAAALVLGGYREIRNRQRIAAEKAAAAQAEKDAASIIKSIDAMRAEDPALREAMAARKSVASALLTPGAAAMLESNRIT